MLTSHHSDSESHAGRLAQPTQQHSNALALLESTLPRCDPPPRWRRHAPLPILMAREQLGENQSCSACCGQFSLRLLVS